MTPDEKDLEEFGKKTLAPIKDTPTLDPSVQAEERTKFLQLGENLRAVTRNSRTRALLPHDNAKSTPWLGRSSTPLYKVLVTTLLVLLFVAASSISVYAAQGSLPGEPLYPVKSLSEDIRLSMTFSTQSKLDLTLDYTNRRIGEIRILIADGKSVPVQAAARYQNELEDALQLAAQLDDTRLKNALNQVKNLAEDQGMSVEELKLKSPNQNSTAFLRLQERLQEQVQLSSMGERDPREFRKEIQERAHDRQGPRHLPTSDEIQSTDEYFMETPIASPSDNGASTPSPEPGDGNHDSNPGNGNHGVSSTHTPKP